MIQIHQLDLKNIKRHETELKWINFLQSPFVKALMITSTMKVTFLKYQILMFFFLFLNVKHVKVDLMVNVSMVTLSAKFVLKKRLNTSLKDLSIALNNHGQHGLFSF